MNSNHQRCSLNIQVNVESIEFPQILLFLPENFDVIIIKAKQMEMGMETLHTIEIQANQTTEPRSTDCMQVLIRVKMINETKRRVWIN